MSRVTVLLPFVPEIDTIGIVRSASRIHDGGVVPASAIRAVQRASSRSWAPVRWARRGRRDVPLRQGQGGLGERQRAFEAGPRERDDPVARVGRSMDGQPAPALAVLEPQAPDPGHDAGHVVRPLARRDVGPEPDEGMPAGIALAVPGPSLADGHLELDHRLQPVDIRALEQTRLHQSHGPGRIASRHGLDWPPRRTPGGS